MPIAYTMPTSGKRPASRWRHVACTVVLGLMLALPSACPPCQAHAADASTFSIEVSDTTYTGSPQQPKLSVKQAGRELARGADYLTSWRKNVNAGTGTVVVTGIGSHSGKKTATFTIRPASIADATVSGIETAYTATGSAITPSPAISFGKKQLKAETDYEISYQNNVQAGTASIVLSGKRNLIGQKTVTFKIEAPKAAKTPLSKATVSVKSVTYTGKALKPKVTVKLSGKTLKAGTDYTVAYSNNKKVGTGKVKVTGKGSYSGSKTAKFKIKGKPLSKAKIAKIADQWWTGKVLKPKPKVTYGKTTLKSGRDYTIRYKSNKNIGTATIIVSGKGNYAGTKKAAFKIRNAGDDLARAACRISYSRGVYYGGGANDRGRYASTALWKRVYSKCSPNPNSPWKRGCVTAIRAIVRWSGYDDTFPCPTASTSKKYQTNIKSKPGKWKIVGTWNGKTSSLKPGDILITQANGIIGPHGSGHELMYVGHDIAMEIYKKYLKGTDADLGAPRSNDVFVSSHGAGNYNSSRSSAPCICNASFSLANYKGFSYCIIRPVKGQNVSNSGFKNVEAKARPYK